MNCKLLRFNKFSSLLGALAFLALLPSAAFAAIYNLTYRFDIVTNYSCPGAPPYLEQRNIIQSTGSDGARWGIVGEDPAGVITNVHGQTRPLDDGGDPDKWWTIRFRTMANYYVPISSNIHLAADTPLIHWYAPYTNTLSVKLTGTNGMTSNVVWYFSSCGELSNSTAYKTFYTNDNSLTPIPTGEYVVVFPSVTGYRTPAQITTNITSRRQVDSVTGEYSRIDGAVSYLLLPYHHNYITPGDYATLRDRVQAAGRWRLTGSFIASRPWDTNMAWETAVDTNTPPNPYMVDFNRVQDCYESMTETNLTVTNADMRMTNWYYPYSNSLAVVITGLTSGAISTWQITPFEELTNSSLYKARYTNSLAADPAGLFPTGIYEISFNSVIGYTAPSPITTNISGSRQVAVTGGYSRLRGNIQIVMTPGAAASNAPWTLTGPADFNITNGTGNRTGAATISNVPAGSYTVTFGTLYGYTTPAEDTDTVQSNQTVILTGNYIDLGVTLVVHIGPPFPRQTVSALPGIGSGPCRVVFNGITNNQTADVANYSVYSADPVTVTLTSTNTEKYVYKWYLTSDGETDNAHINDYRLWSNSVSFVMNGDKAVWLLYSNPYNDYDHAGDIDHDALPDTWEVAWFGDDGNTLSAPAPQAELWTNAYANGDGDFVPSASATAATRVSMVTNIITYSGVGADPGYPLSSVRLLTQQEAPSDSRLGYSTGLKFNNLLECRGLDGYYLTNGPGFVRVPNDDPLTSPVAEDTDGDGMTDGWEYYFWYWRSADTTNRNFAATNFSWVTLKPTVWNMPDWDTDGDEISDLEEHDDTWTDPTHCDSDADGMDDCWEINVIIPSANSNALDNLNGLLNPDSDYMAVVTNVVLTNQTPGRVLGTNICWDGGAISNPSSAWLDLDHDNVFTLFRDNILKVSETLSNGTPGALYAFTNFFETRAGLTYKAGYPVWVDVDRNGTYTLDVDYALVNPNIRHDGVYCKPPPHPEPGVCMFDPRTAWTNAFPGLFSAIHQAPNTAPYTTYQEYLGGDYIGRLCWDAGGHMTNLNDNVNALTRNSYSNPQNEDTDGDLIPDGWELYTGMNPNAAGDAANDPDRDALNNFMEWANTTHPLGNCVSTWALKSWPTDPGVIRAPPPNDPHPRDTDWDGLVDGYAQIEFTSDDGGTSSTVTTNVGELASGTNPTDVDSDHAGSPFGDGLPDGWEVYAGTDPLVQDANLDSDFDGLYNWQEYWTGTVPEWMDCDPAWGLFFFARRVMDWNLSGDAAWLPNSSLQTNRYGWFRANNVDARDWFLPPDFMSCPSFLFANGVVTNLDWLRSTNGFPASASLGCENYHTTFASTNHANATDSDVDALDDFWEVFHCLNPIRGYRDLVYGSWGSGYYGRFRVGSIDADTTNTPGYQVGTQGAPFTNVMDLITYYRGIRDNPSLDEKVVAVSMIVGPHNFGLEGMDPDGDGLTTFAEYSYYRLHSLAHTCPSPLYRTTHHANFGGVGVYNFIPRNYGRDNTTQQSGWSSLGFSGVSYRDPDSVYPFRTAAETEGFDTDNDLISDSDELTGFRTNGVVAATDPLNDESPLKNRVLWLDGTNSCGVTHQWSPYGDFTRFSIEAWARPSRLSAPLDQVIAEKCSLARFQNPNGSFSERFMANFQLGIDADGVPYILFDSMGGNVHRATAVSVGGQVAVDKWVHLAGVFDGSNLTLFVNGEANATHFTTDVPARGIEGDYAFHANDQLIIGCGFSSGGFFAGCLSEIRVWDRVISAGEVKARKDRRLTPEEVGTVIGGNGPYSEGANNLFAYYRFTDLPDPRVDGIIPSGFPTDRPVYWQSDNVYSNYQKDAADRVKRIRRMPSLDARVVDGTPIATNPPPDAYGISTTNYLTIPFPADFRNSANPYNFTHAMYVGHEMGRGLTLFGLAQGLKTNTWLPTLDDNDSDSVDTDGDGLPDWWEQLYGLDIHDATGINGAWGDPDNDGLDNRAEYLAGTSPRNSDTDGDGIGDYDSRSGPYKRTWGEMYMDGDGMPDTWEIDYGLDPYHYDAQLDLDGDGWSNLSEYLAETNPNDSSSFPQPHVMGTVAYFGSQTIQGNNYRFYAYTTNTMDGVPEVTTVGAGQQVAGYATADGTRFFYGRLPLYPLDHSTVVTISAPVGGTNSAVFVFTSPTTYTYTGPGTDCKAGLNYETGLLSIEWASSGIPRVGAQISIEYVYLNRNAAVFDLTGFKEGDTYLMSYIDMDSSGSIDQGEPMGILDSQPLDLSYTSPNNIRVHVKDSAPGYGRFVWTANASATSDYPVVINRISETNAPIVFSRTVRWSRNFVHEWDYQLMGSHGLASGRYQWWMNNQQNTFDVTWPAAVSTPALVYPRGDQFYYAKNQLKWTMDVNSTMYHLQVGRQLSNRAYEMVIDQYYPTPYCNGKGVFEADLPMFAGELGDGVYAWRVAGWNPAMESAWSEPQTFAIDLNATISYWIKGDIYYFGKADASNIYVEAFENKGFSGKPAARMLLTGADRTNSFKGAFNLRGLEQGTYYVRAYLDVTPAGGTRSGKLDRPWESFGFIRDPTNNYQPQAVQLLGVVFVEGTKIVIRDHDTDNDLLPDAWEMYYFGNLEQTGDMDYDGDGETNLEEYMRDDVNMNPAAWDTDGDGLSDAFELNYTAPSFGYSAKSGVQLNPMLWDTDGDGYSDGAEMKRYHTNPLDLTSYPRYQPLCFDAARSPADYDGDGRSDLSVYDITLGNWYIMTAGGLFGSMPFGSPGSQPMLGDYDGDGRDDLALYEAATGGWFLYNLWTAQSFHLSYGDSEMIPVPGDYDGDNKTDLALYYPAEGIWYIYCIWSGQLCNINFGGPTMIPVPGDYNCDMANDLAVYEPNTGNWNIFAFDHYRLEGTYYSGNFGGPTMIPVPGDYDGDGRNDVALFEQGTGNWYIMTWKGQFCSGQFGWYGCIPAPGDYDGDGRTDVCFYYPPTGVWFIYCWTGQYFQAQFGFPAATPAVKGR